MALDGRRRGPVPFDCSPGGGPIPDAIQNVDPRAGRHADGHADRDASPAAGRERAFAELERVVAALVDRFQHSQGQVSSLRRELAERDRRLQEQTREIRGLNQRHQDVAKRLDELIAELDRLDAQLAEGAEGTGPER